MSLLANLIRGKTRPSPTSVLRSTPELIPLLSAVSFGCAYGIYKMIQKTATDPHLRVRQNEGREPENAWQSRV
ncbi:hypothetical protein H9P43_004575 [Blastocladiella emersonii ATCC 22665]|nr:hypothetical protein H9P43_004575 [Blastocladiella emersonii ATCC 22665]